MTAFFKNRAGALQLVFVIGVIGTALVVSALLKPEPRATRAAQPAADIVVSVVRPSATTFQPTIVLNGVVETRSATELVPQVSGRIVTVSEKFRAGAEVKANSVLFRIDPSDYELAVEQTLAEIEAARSELALLEAQSAAEQRIWDQKFPNRQIPELTAKIPQIAAAKARIKSAIAARKAAELALARTTVRAPYDARVLSTTLALGQVVGSASSVGRIFAVDSLEIGVPISAQDLARMGQVENREARILLSSSNNQAIQGTVARRAASLDARTRLARLFVAPENRSLLTVGEFVTVEIRGDIVADAYRIPASALTSRDQVWIVAADTLQVRTIEVIGREGDEAIVKQFDVGEGLVSIPPADGRAGASVAINNLASQTASPKSRQ